MSDDDGDHGDVGEHEVDDSKLKLPDVKLADVKVSTMEEEEDVIYKQLRADAGSSVEGESQGWPSVARRHEEFPYRRLVHAFVAAGVLRRRCRRCGHITSVSPCCECRWCASADCWRCQRARNVLLLPNVFWNGPRCRSPGGDPGFCDARDGVVRWCSASLTTVWQRVR